jgi:hypothetical protein
MAQRVASAPLDQAGHTLPNTRPLGEPSKVVRTQ